MIFSLWLSWHLSPSFTFLPKLRYLVTFKEHILGENVKRALPYAWCSGLLQHSQWKYVRERARACACVCARAWVFVRSYNPFLAVRMWLTECNNFMPETPRLLSCYHPLLFFFFFCHGEVCSVCLCEPKPPVFLTASFVEVNMFPRVILRGTMIKKSQQKKRTSPCNYKERFFVLDTQNLKYSERRPGVSVLCLIG